MAITGYTINGPALVYVGTGGSGALQLLGYTDGGVELEMMENSSEIFTDVFGPMTPQDFQQMGIVARVVAPLVAIDEAVQAGIINRTSHTAGFPGLTGLPGQVLGVGGYAYRLAIASGQAPAAGNLIFSAAIIRPRWSWRMATKVFPQRFEWFCWPYAPYTATSGRNQSLYTVGAIPGYTGP